MSSKRLWFLFSGFFLVAIVLSWRLFSLQIIEGSDWRAQAQGQQRIFTQKQGDRGDIYFSNNGDNILVATNKKIYHAHISPRRLSEDEKEELAYKFSEILDIDKDMVLERTKRDSAFEIIKRNLTSEEIEKVKETEEIYIQEEIVRHYPEGNFASHVIGFVGGEGVGQYGVEGYYEDTLKGKTGIREGLKNNLGYLITRDSVEKGEDLFLTIDYNIQHFTEKKLEETVEKFNAKSGMAIVGDPNTGEILAMVSYPSFNLNEYSRTETSLFRNANIQMTFEPGSVFKPITMAIALNERAVDPSDTFYDSGSRQIFGRTLYNYGRRSYGQVDMSRILENSINTGIIYVKDQIGNQLFLEYLHDFGFFETTGIDLNGEVFSKNRGFLQGHEVNFATASYGQGIEVTAIQIFRSFSIIANGGVMIDPHIVKRSYHGEDRERIISEEAASLVTEMMINTIEDGFGGTAKVPGYHIAGKTGTAQVAWSKLGINRAGYSNETLQGFVGFAPALDPEFVIYVNLDNPQSRSAEVSVGPLFREIASFIFEYKKIPPDYNPSR